MTKFNLSGFWKSKRLLIVLAASLVIATGFYSRSIEGRPAGAANNEVRATGYSQIPLSRGDVGSVYVCRPNSNFYHGIKYYFKGQNAKVLDVSWITWRTDGSINDPDARGQLSPLRRAKVIRFSGKLRDGRPPIPNYNAWYFKLSSKGTPAKKATSQLYEHSMLRFCP